MKKTKEVKLPRCKAYFIIRDRSGQDLKIEKVYPGKSALEMKPVVAGLCREGIWGGDYFYPAHRIIEVVINEITEANQ